jgi:thiopurine S-methyltransferase
MEPDFWHERWRQNRIGFHQREINVHLQAFWPELAMPPGGQVFVPLCGKSLDMLWLRAQGHGVLGVEISPIAVRDFFAENRLEAEIRLLGDFEQWEADGLVLLQGDFFDLTWEDLAPITGVYDRASLIALPTEMRPRYVEHFARIVPATAPTLLVTLEYRQSEMDGPPFSVGEAEVRALYEDRFQVERLAALDVLAENPRFRAKGLSGLTEKVYRLRRAG